MTNGLIYVANARLPGEKAHGHAIVKMCEAYSCAGLDVDLGHPRRQQDRRIVGRSVFEYDEVEPTFRVRMLANVDVIAVDACFPRSVFPWVMGAHPLNGWKAWRKKWTAKNVPVQPSANTVTLTVEDIKGLTTTKTVKVTG